ncbi:MAG: GIY-YIG nuclease family protein [Propionibacteriales bacterium]|nr:GIY-YIG nuclease family protein [Propionibacteriales bacterium]
MPFTYILRCADGSYYVGSTTHLETRLWQHNHSELGAEYTRRRRPVVLVWHHRFESVGQAYAFEQQVQGWSRAKREALIRGDFDVLAALSRRGHLRKGSQ